MAKSYKGVLKSFDAAPERVRGFFPEFKQLVEDFSWEVSVTYVFSRVEQAKRSAIYCGILKLHRCDASLTRTLVDKDYLSRERFFDLFKVVFDKKIPDEIRQKLKKGEDVRDKIAHGTPWEEPEVRDGLVAVLEFAAEFNDFVQKIGGFQPFGDLRGFKGRAKSLTPETTRWVLRGMGIPKHAEA